ncbi:MAG: AGCS family alanine or glycine:cation symporter [Planctomycetota bacterium]|jgi:AGCS family alanine or glycine:cation symporter
MRIQLRLALAAIALFLCAPQGITAPLQDTDAPAAEIPLADSTIAANAADAAAAAIKDRESALAASLKASLDGRADTASAKVDVPQAEAADWQESIDRVMASVNGFVAGFFFYDLGGSSVTLEGFDPALAADPAALKSKVDELIALAEREGLDFSTSAVSLTVPRASAGADEMATLKAVRTGWPLAVLWLVLGAIFFTVRMGLVQLRFFGHAIAVTAGKYDDPNDKVEGEVTHFQALSAALSATVGLGNIAGVAIAISLGGPGATLWMILAGFLGMASKFTECSLGQMYKVKRPDGSVMGGAMYYLSTGFKEAGHKGIGRFLAVSFAILCVGGSLAGGNSFQVNQSLGALKETVPFFADNSWVYGLIMTAAVGAVILGGLKRIAETAEKIVPTMCTLYVLAAMYIIMNHASEVPAALGMIWEGAFNPAAGFGGLMGVLVMGFKRAAFSNEAGVGSAAIAHSAAHCEYPVREGIVALLEPFIDTIVICTMTALVIIMTGAYDPTVNGGMFAPYIESANGAGLTSKAFGSEVSWFPYLLSVAVVMFAFSTMISWSYYGERCWVWLFGDKSSRSYKILFLTFVFLGSVITAKQVLEFGDLMILGMAFPNVIGVIFLSGKVKKALGEYQEKLKSGEIKRHS